MRLSRPIYETLPLAYAGIGGLGILLAYLDPVGPQDMVAFSIGLIAETAALTVYLRRQDYRELSREYSGETIEYPSTLN